MEIGLAIALIILALVAGLIGGFVAGIFLGSLRRRPQTPPPSVLEMRASPNYLCFNENCFTLLSYEIQNPSQQQVSGENIQLTSKKEGDDERRPVQGVDLTPNFSRPFSSTDTGMFYDGPGFYRIGLHLLPSATTAPNREVSVLVLSEDRPLINTIMSGESSSTLISSVSESKLFADVENEKASIRTCKGTKIIGLTLTRVFINPVSNFNEEQWQSIREADGLGSIVYPEEVNLQIIVNQNSIWSKLLRVDETVFFGSEIAGTQNPELTNAIDVAQGLELIGTRQSGDNPFPRYSIVGWQISLHLSCL